MQNENHFSVRRFALFTILVHLLGALLCANIAHAVSDVNADNQVGLEDALIILQTIAGKPTQITHLPSNGILSASNLPDNGYSIAVKNDHAFVCQSYGGVQVVDISIKEFPRNIKKIAMTGQVLDITIQNNFAYVAAFGYGLYILNIQDPAATFIAGKLQVSGNHFNGIAVAGNYAYLGDLDNGLYVIDISTPTAPFLAATLPRQDGFGNLCISGNFLYASEGWGVGVQSIDISNPTTPVIVDSIALPGYAAALTSNDTHLFAVDSHYGLRVINISDPTNLQETGYIPLEKIRGIDLYANTVYLTVSDSVTPSNVTTGILAIDVSLPAAPALSGTIKTGNTNGIKITDGYIYTTSGMNGLNGNPLVNFLKIAPAF